MDAAAFAAAAVFVAGFFAATRRLVVVVPASDAGAAVFLTVTDEPFIRRCAVPSEGQHHYDPVKSALVTRGTPQGRSWWNRSPKGAIPALLRAMKGGSQGLAVSIWCTDPTGSQRQVSHERLSGGNIHRVAP